MSAMELQEFTHALLGFSLASVLPFLLSISSSFWNGYRVQEVKATCFSNFTEARSSELPWSLKKELELGFWTMVELLRLWEFLVAWSTF
jgi:hypothetical protein